MVSRPNIHPQKTFVSIIFYACPRCSVKIICKSLLVEVPAVIDILFPLQCKDKQVRTTDVCVESSFRKFTEESWYSCNAVCRHC